MYTLYKYSSPCFTKKFESVEELTETLRGRICGTCIKEGWGNDLIGMLQSDCGCEYGVEGIDNEHPATTAEMIQEHYDKVFIS